MQRVNVMQSRCLGEGKIASLSANFVLRKERQTCCLGKGDRDAAAWRQSAETQKRPVMLLPSVDEPYCLLFLAKLFSPSAKVCWVQWIRGRGLPRGQGRGSIRQNNPAIVWMSSVFRVVTSSIIASSKNVTYHCTKAGQELVPAKCGIIRHSCRKKHLNLQNQTMTVLQIHLPLTHPVPLGPSHIPLVMQRCSRNEFCAGRTTFWYPQQRNPFPETPNTSTRVWIICKESRNQGFQLEWFQWWARSTTSICFAWSINWYDSTNVSFRDLDLDFGIRTRKKSSEFLDFRPSWHLGQSGKFLTRPWCCLSSIATISQSDEHLWQRLFSRLSGHSK